MLRQVFGYECGIKGFVKVSAWAARACAVLAALACAHLSGASRVALAAEAPPVVIENVGQFDAAARFRIPGGGSTVWIADGAIFGGVVLGLAMMGDTLSAAACLLALVGGG